MELEPHLLHPLLIPSVVSEILTYLPVQSICAARFVSQLWATEGSKVFLKRRRNVRFVVEEDEEERQGEFPIARNVFKNKFPSWFISSKVPVGLSVCFKDPFKINVKSSERDERALAGQGDADADLRETHKAIAATLSVHVFLVDLFRTEPTNLSRLSLGAEAWNVSIFQYCFEAFGETLTSLTLHSCGLSPAEGIKGIKALRKTQPWPNLKEFGYHHRAARQLQGQAAVLESMLDAVEPNFVKSLLKQFPNLEKFACSDKNFAEKVTSKIIHRTGEGDIENEDFEEVLLGLGLEELLEPMGLAQPPPVPMLNLKQFDFELNLSEEEVKTLSELLKCPLEDLNMSLRPGLRFPGLYTFLSGLGGTLKTLRIDFVLVLQTPEAFPCGRDLVNLEELSMKNYNGSLSFIHSMPKLKVLELTKVNLSVALGEDTDLGLRLDLPHTGLESLKVYEGHSSAGRFSFTHIFHKLVKLFPKLRTLRMDYLSDSMVKIVCQGFKQLEELIMENSVCGDEGVVGSNERLKLKTSDQMETDEGTTEPPTCVCGIKNLRKLTIISPKITNLSLQGLAHCKELRHLELSSPLITGPALLELVKEINLEGSLTLKDCYQVSHPQWTLLSEAVPNNTKFTCILSDKVVFCSLYGKSGTSCTNSYEATSVLSGRTPVIPFF